MNEFINRRNFLNRAGMGMGMLGMGMLSADEKKHNPLKAKSPLMLPKAKRVIHIFCNGGASHIDTFDPKPLLDKYAGKKLPVHFKTERETGGAYPSPFKFKKYGQSGIPISEIFS